MKTLEQDELFNNLQGFLKTKGVDLKQGSYSQTIQKGCALLSEAINTGQEGFTRAKGQIDKKLDQLRQIIHEKTAPPKPGSAPPPPPASEPATARQAAARKAKPKAKTPKRPKNRKHS